MARKEHLKKGTKIDGNKGKQKEKKSSSKQHNTEIISEEELNERGGICGNTTLYLTMHLILFLDHSIIYHHTKKLKELAEFIHRQKVLYTPKHGGYKLMEISSINTELAALKKSVQKQYQIQKEKERKETEKFKSKY